MYVPTFVIIAYGAATVIFALWGVCKMSTLNAQKGVVVEALRDLCEDCERSIDMTFDNPDDAYGSVQSMRRAREVLNNFDSTDLRCDRYDV